MKVRTRLNTYLHSLFLPFTESAENYTEEEL